MRTPVVVKKGCVRTGLLKPHCNCGTKLKMGHNIRNANESCAGKSRIACDEGESNL